MGPARRAGGRAGESESERERDPQREKRSTRRIGHGRGGNDQRFAHHSGVGLVHPVARQSSSMRVWLGGGPAAGPG